MKRLNPDTPDFRICPIAAFMLLIIVSCSDKIDWIDRPTLEDLISSSSENISSSSEEASSSSSEEISSSSGNEEEGDSSSSEEMSSSSEEDNSSSSGEEDNSSSSSNEENSSSSEEGNSSSSETASSSSSEELSSSSEISSSSSEVSSSSETKCGDTPYDQEIAFCRESDQTLHSCGNKPFDPDTQDCVGNTIFIFCGNNGVPQNTKEIFCYNNEIVPLCGGTDGESYDLETEFCYDGDDGARVLKKCNGKVYTPPEYCNTRNEIYNTCNGTPYKVETHFCWRETITPLCAGKTFADDEECWKNNAIIGTFIDDGDGRDGKEYKYTIIGDQTWMAENLKYAASGSKCIDGNLLYDVDKPSCITYGRIYGWKTAMANSASSNTIPSGVRGVCPFGWHLPSEAEWNTLMTYVGGISTASPKLKAESGWSNKGSDDFGFAALPGGRSSNESGSTGTIGCWWNTTNESAYVIENDYEDVSRYTGSSTQRNSVRCVKDP